MELFIKWRREAAYELRLLIFPQPLGGALKNQSAAPASPPCFRRRRRSAPLLFSSHWASHGATTVDIPTDWNPRAKRQPTGLIAYLACGEAALFSSHWTPHDRKRPASICSRVFLVGCPVGLEPTVSRSTIWRVNRLRYGHHINAPEGTRTPGPLLRRQLLYPPELRAHVVIPLGSDMVCSCESKHAARSIIP